MECGQRREAIQVMSLGNSQHFIYDYFLEAFLNLYVVKFMGFAFDIMLKSSVSSKEYITIHLWFFYDLTFYI